MPHVASSLLFGSVVRRLCTEMEFLSHCMSNTILSGISHGCSNNYYNFKHLSLRRLGEEVMLAGYQLNVLLQPVLVQLLTDRSNLITELFK